MSSPSRQISNRRLPPLPNSSRSSPIRRIPSGGSVKTASASSNSRHGPASNHQGSQVNNHGHYDLNVPFSDGPFRPALIQGKAIERPTPETHGKPSLKFFDLERTLRHLFIFLTTREIYLWSLENGVILTLFIPCNRKIIPGFVFLVFNGLWALRIFLMSRESPTKGCSHWDIVYGGL